ncbi:MAG: glycoside hydrolase domain-containing protein, partial [Ginsengibacter sp.]
MFYKIICTIFLLLCNVTGNAQTLKYEVAQKPWAAGLGNHRAILTINKPANAVGLNIRWRLHDLHPDKKRFLIMNATTGDTIQNVYRISVSDERCDIAFGPVTKRGKYYFYYLPYKPDTNAGYYQYGYLFPKMPDAEWIDKNHLSDKTNISKLTSASCEVLESRTEFDSFYPMEIIGNL